MRAFMFFSRPGVGDKIYLNKKYEMINQGLGHLIPARFLTLLAHMAICIVTLSSTDSSIKASLPEEFEEQDYQSKDFQFKLGLYLALAFITVELVGFLSGTSMFLPSVASLSVGCHASACVLISHLLIDNWSVAAYWWVFAFCSVIPAVLELAVTFNAHVLKRIN